MPGPACASFLVEPAKIWQADPKAWRTPPDVGGGYRLSRSSYLASRATDGVTGGLAALAGWCIDT